MLVELAQRWSGVGVRKMGIREKVAWMVTLGMLLLDDGDSKTFETLSETFGESDALRSIYIYKPQHLY